MLVSLFAAALAFTSPAPEAPDGISCILDQTSPQDQSLVGNGILAGTDLANGEIADRIGLYVAGCVQRHGWDEARALQLSILSVNAMARNVALQRLDGAGIEVAALDRWFDSQTEDFRTRAFLEMTDEEATPVLETLEATSIPLALLEQHAELVGGYLSTRVLMFRAERGLPLD